MQNFTDKKIKKDNKVTEASKIPVSEVINKPGNINKIVIDDDDEEELYYNNNSNKICEEMKIEEPIIKKANIAIPKQIVPKQEIKKLVPIDPSNFFSKSFPKVETKPIKVDKVIEEIKNNDMMDVDDIEPAYTLKEEASIIINASPIKISEKLTPIKEKNTNIETKTEEVKKQISFIEQSTPKIKPKAENKPIQTKTDIRKENINNNALWTTKYNPKSISDIIGNQSQVNKIIDWLNHWNDVVLKGNLRDLPSECKLFLI